MLILQARWFTRSERARANALLVMGNPSTLLWMSVISGYLAHSLGWRMMFVVEGLPPVIWAFVWWRLVSDRPSDAKWLAAEDRVALEAKLADEQRGIAPVRNYGAAFRNPRVIALCVQYFLWSLGLYGFVIWLPSILKGSSMGMVELGWLSALPYLAALIVEFLNAAWSDRTGRRKIAMWPSFAFLDQLRAAGDRGRGDVRALWSVLRLSGRDLAVQCRRRRHRADQQHGGAGLLRGRLWRGPAQWRHRQSRHVLSVHGGGAARLRRHHILPAGKETGLGRARPSCFDGLSMRNSSP
jgi:hypothetical protein